MHAYAEPAVDPATAAWAKTLHHRCVSPFIASASVWPHAGMRPIVRKDQTSWRGELHRVSPKNWRGRVGVTGSAHEVAGRTDPDRWSGVADRDGTAEDGGQGRCAGVEGGLGVGGFGGG